MIFLDVVDIAIFAISVEFSGCSAFLCDVGTKPLVHGAHDIGQRSAIDPRSVCREPRARPASGSPPSSGRRRPCRSMRMRLPPRWKAMFYGPSYVPGPLTPLPGKRHIRDAECLRHFDRVGRKRHFGDLAILDGVDIA